jgi:two-component system CheB/CheR fusion protein
MSPENGGPSLRSLLDYLRTSRGFDFSVYKPTTLTRRIAKRLQAVGVADYREYIDRLEVHPEEFTELFNTNPASGSGAPAAPPARRPTVWP